MERLGRRHFLCRLRYEKPGYFAYRFLQATRPRTFTAATAVYGRNCRFLQGAMTDRETIQQVREAIAEHRPVAVEVLIGGLLKREIEVDRHS